MKKIFFIALSILVMLGTNACTSEQVTPNEITLNEVSRGPAFSNGRGTSVDGMDDNLEYIFGMVKSVVGNEVELMLAEVPEVPEDEDNIDSFVEEKLTIGERPSVVAATPIIGGSGGMDIEFTGETITFTIPTGTEILKMGNKSTVAGIKNGQLLGMFVDDLETMNIETILIME